VVDEALQSAFEASDSLGCILCGRDTNHVGVFTPDRGVDYGVLPGWRFIYRLCDDHLADWPAVKSRVERHIWKQQRAKVAGIRGQLDALAKSR
jgi:hypothetical protein